MISRNFFAEPKRRNVSKVAARPAVKPATLRLNPEFDPLRNDPRFQKLCEAK